MFGSAAGEFDFEPSVEGDLCRVTVTHRATKKTWHWEGSEEEWQGEGRDKFLAQIANSFKPN